MRKTKVLVTGSSGSAASYLIYYLNFLDNYEIHGISKKLYKSRYNQHQCDLTDYSSVYRTINKIQPDYIYNLASNADVKFSFDNPISVLNNNINSTVNILEAVKESQIDCVIQHCSTSEVYGEIKESDGPVDENYSIKPANIYAVSKLTQEQLVLSYYRMYNIPVIITRAFGYINPKRHNIFSTAFAYQISQIEKGNQEKLFHGNLSSIRTLMDVRDIVRAYVDIMEKGDFGEIYNIGSSDPYSVQQILHKLIDRAKTKIELSLNNDLLRPSDITHQIPNTDKFVKKLNWFNDYDLEESLDWLLNYCRMSV